MFKGEPNDFIEIMEKSTRNQNSRSFSIIQGILWLLETQNISKQMQTNSLVVNLGSFFNCNKGVLDKYTIIPQLFPKISWDFYTIRSVSIVVTACWVLHSKLTYFWRNMNISSIFYFSKSASINTQYSSLWDTLKVMLFTKYLIKWKRIGRISWKFWYWFNSKSSVELDVKR